MINTPTVDIFNMDPVLLAESAAQVSKEIAWLEQELKVQLLLRTTRSLKLTECGQQFYIYAKRSIADYDQIRANLQKQSGKLSGRLRITLSASVADYGLCVPITAFACQHPGVALDIITTSQVVDLVSEQVDIGIRTQQIQNAGYECYPFISIQRGVFASPDYLKHYGTPLTPQVLQEHKGIVSNSRIQAQQWLFKDGQEIDIPITHTCNSVPFMIHMAKQGLGCIYIARNQVCDALKEETLVEVLQNARPPATPLYLVHAKQAYVPQRLQAFIAHLLEYAKQQCVG